MSIFHVTRPTLGLGRAASSSVPPAFDPDGSSSSDSGELEIELPPPALLIVDDVPANLVSLEATLEPLGYRVVRASSGEEALKKLLVEEFAVILLDVQMPGLDGFETAALIKSHPRMRSTPIIFITAISRDAEHVFQGYARGAVDYMLKPFDPDILRSKVSVFVDLYLRGERIKAQSKLLRQRDLELVERRGRERYFRLIDAMPIALWATRSDGSVYYANRAWGDYVGAGAGDYVGFTDPRVVHEEDRERLTTAWHDALREGNSLDIEARLRRNDDGAYQWHLLRALPQWNDRGDIEGWIVTATNIHERKRAEVVRAELLEREQAARRQAEVANRLKDEFLATVSHELRTPLHAIVGWVKMLRTGLIESEKVQHALDTIERNAHAQTALVDDILDVSRIITGKLRIQVRPTQLPAVVEAAVEALRPAAENKSIRLELSMDEFVDFDMLGDPNRIQQVVWNLVANAVKFTPQGGSVRVTLEREDETARIVVADSGIGIGPEFLPYVFDRFSQADSGMTRAHGGLGLGLAIVRHLVELHGGTVRADSAGAGRGSTFTVVLPMRQAQTEVEPEVSAKTSQITPRPGAPLRHLGGMKVLVVDDDTDARDLLQAVLERCGAEVVGCECAQDALEAVQEHHPDVLVSDIGLPGEDGYSLIRQVRELPPSAGGETPAIAVSGYARSDDRTRALSEGFQAHLAKPVELSELVSMVAQLADRAMDARGPQRRAGGSAAS